MVFGRARDGGTENGEEQDYRGQPEGNAECCAGARSLKITAKTG
jgi:hypothetical protein